MSSGTAWEVLCLKYIFPNHNFLLVGLILRENINKSGVRIFLFLQIILVRKCWCYQAKTFYKNDSSDKFLKTSSGKQHFSFGNHTNYSNHESVKSEWQCSWTTEARHSYELSKFVLFSISGLFLGFFSEISVFHSDLRNCLRFVTDFCVQEIQGKHNAVHEKGRFAEQRPLLQWAEVASQTTEMN